MTIIKCKMCGGDIKINPDQPNYGTCDSCGSVSTLPKVSDERKANLFNRANHFRRLNDFDKAINAYERILNEDHTDAEAHWGVVLSRYGIEYVEDPKTHERIPTCHRVQRDSILRDGDYLAAIKYAPDTYSRELYEKEAKKISEIQKGILAISSKEEPYDVFICYKESTDGGSRTKDSALGQDIYYQLTNKGYKVFFARITLEDMLGREYEPYIFAALSSAKVMVVIGTKPEYFNAVWVKNEWSRFLEMMKTDRNKLLIPCYRDMDPYDLPDELSMLQSQDMSKIGFLQDLIRGIAKVTEEAALNPVSGKTVVSDNSSALLKRAFMFLEEANWGQADKYCERVLDIEPENADAYLGKLLAKLQVKTIEALEDYARPFDDELNYKRLMRFTDEMLKRTLEGYNASIRDRIEKKNESERKMLIYRNALKKKESANAEKEFLDAAELFESISSFIDSEELAQSCYLLRDEFLKQEEIKTKEAVLREKKNKELMAEEARTKQIEQERLKQIKKRRKKLIIIISIFLLTISVVGISIKHSRPFTIDKENGQIKSYSSFGSREVVIPKFIGDVKVRSIGNSVFENKGIIQVTIPDSVESIGHATFSNNKLTTLTIPDSVESIGRSAFSNNKLTTLTIPDSIESIGHATFINNELTILIISDNVITIGNFAFKNNELKALTIPDSVESIGSYAFENNKITTLTIPDGIKSMGDFVFYKNPLNSVSIPNESDFKNRNFSDDNKIKYTIRN